MQRGCNSKKEIYLTNVVSISRCLEDPSRQIVGPFILDCDFAIDFKESQVYM